MPTFNRADAIGLTLQHLTHQTLPPDQFEVIVLDDGSTDQSEHIIASQSWPFDLTYLKQLNKGAAAARNLGARHAKAALVQFLDADVIPEPQLLEVHLQSHRQTAHHLIVGRVKPWPGLNRLWYEQIVDPESVGMDYGDQARTIPFYMALGGNFSISRQAFTEIGGYDESFPAAGCEETEFAYRAELRGYPLLYQPSAIGYHNHPRTLEQRCHQQTAHMQSMALLIVKHPHLQAEILGVDELMPLWSKPRSMKALWRRGRALLLGLAPVRALLYRSLTWLDGQQKWPRLASILFWRLSTGWRYVGFHQGLRHYGLGGPVQ